MDLLVFPSFVVLALAQAYAVRCLLLEQKDGHEGPFKFGAVIYFPQTAHAQRACLWDRIRNLFGVYERQDDSPNIWRVKQDAAERWTCAFCLSFWVSFLFCIPFCAYFDLILFYPVVHLALSYLSTVFVGLVNFVLRL